MQPTRRSSAASSRHNSLSSTHSHQSHTSGCSYKGRPASNHVAQHLRRASILETRKARLADRAAYAEQVRQRAAEAKALPRASNLEERALAAQVAREKYLAGVAATCAEEVRRAKKVAEATKEKRHADNLKLRFDMQEKLAEAERRRTEYQNARRSFNSSAHSSDPSRPRSRGGASTETKAVKRIQSAWRARLRQRVVNDFLELNLTVEKVRDQSFEDVSVRLADSHTITRTSKVLTQFGLTEDRSSNSDKAAAKLFLSAFLILSHPTSVFIQDGDQEKDLMTKSRDLLISFESRLSHLDMANEFKPSPESIQSLRESFDTFSSDFEAWKAHDSSFLVGQMVGSFVELDNLRQTIQDEPEDALRRDFEEGIKTQQISLIVRIKRLAGPEKGMKMIQKALKDGRKKRASNRPKDIRPRACVAEVSPTISQPSRDPTALDVHQTVVPNTSVEAGQAFTLPSLLPDNRTLIHEIAVCKGFSLAANTLIDRQAHKGILTALCNAMRSEIEKGKGDSWVIAMVSNVRHRLLNLLSKTNPLRPPIEEVLDPTVTENKVSHGAFSYDHFFAFMNDILPKMCAPIRDDEIKALAEDKSSDYMSKLEKLLITINNMTIDWAQIKLMAEVPELLKEAPGYEALKFSKDLENQVHSLENTQQWWSSARSQVLDEARERNPESINHSASRPTSEQIYLRGLADLALSVSPLDETSFPETLFLDKGRIKQMRLTVLELVSTGAILLTAKNLLRRDIRMQWPSEANTILVLVKQASITPISDLNDLSTQILTTLTAPHEFSPTAQKQLRAFVIRTLTQTQRKQLSDPVLRLLFHRLRTHLVTRLQATKTADRVRLASAATETLAAAGFPEFGGLIRDLAEELVRVSALDRTSHGAWYEDIAKRLEAV
ncbi:MAG: hypothetical protein M1814_000452 [Vezdaea aestivalis]|nr:MAG: hypothetical protein M1814_000452 [Vezdaea aestivalis]